MKSEQSGETSNQSWLTERRFFVLMALILLLITTNRFDTDLPAFAWSLIVLGGTMYLD